MPFIKHESSIQSAQKVTNESVTEQNQSNPHLCTPFLGDTSYYYSVIHTYVSLPVL